MKDTRSKSCTQAVPRKKARKSCQNPRVIDAYDAAFPHGPSDDRRGDGIDGYDLDYPHGYPGESRPRPASKASKGKTTKGEAGNSTSHKSPSSRKRGRGTHRNGTPVVNGKQPTTSASLPNGTSSRNGTAVNGVLPSMLLRTQSIDARCEVVPVFANDQGKPAASSNAAERLMRHPLWVEIDEGSHVIAINPLVRGLLVEGTEMLLMAQVFFWFRAGKNGKPRATIERDGHLWVAKTFAELGKEITRDYYQVKKAVKALKARGYLVVERHRSQFHGHQTVAHFRLDMDTLATAWNAIAMQGEQDAREEDLL